MAEKPIIFSTEMVKAILEGRKTQTRRVVKPQTAAGYDERAKAKYSVGDVLWVRETWRPLKWAKKNPYCYKADLTEQEASLKIRVDPALGYEKNPWKPSIHMPLAAARLFLRVTGVRVEKLQKISPEDCVAEGTVAKPHYMKYGGEKCLAIHSRYKKDFRELWDNINAKRDGGAYARERNPWVWVYTFERVKSGAKK